METAQEKLSVKKPEKEIHQPPTIKDPWELMTRFYESDRYKDSLEGFYKDKEVDPGISEKKKEKTFLENNVARVTLIDFATKDVDFRYESSSYSRRAAEAIDDYIGLVEDFEKMDRGKVSKEELSAMDETRHNYHQKAAEALLKDGVAPTRAIGEAIARLVLIDKGLDDPESAKKESTPRKLKRKITGN